MMLNSAANKQLFGSSFAWKYKDIILLILADISYFIACIFVAFLVRQLLANLFVDTIRLENIWLLLCLPPLLVIGYGLRSLYPGYGIPPAERMSREFWTTAFIFLFLLLYDFLNQIESQARGVYLLGLMIILLTRPLFFGLQIRVLRHFGLWGSPVVIIGASSIGRLVAESLQKSPEIGLIPVAFLDDDINLHGIAIGDCPVVGGLPYAWPLVQQGLTYAIVAMPEEPLPLLERILTQLPFQQIFIVSNLLDFATHSASIREIAGLLTIQYDRTTNLHRNIFLKRALDLLVTIPALLFCAPLLIATGLAIKMMSPGPIIYTQIRAREGIRPIRVLKLRTMYVDAEERLQRLLIEDPAADVEWKTTFKLKQDPRIIKGIGHLIRRTSIDELPQLWNIIRGEMSLVGPRPFPFYHISQFDPEFQRLRGSVKPGLTGYWQILARSDSDLEIQKLLDRYYILNWSLWLDWYILVRTFFVVINGRGAY
jgi:Undecaprenyl-phosphate galactose phosphotransferase WbaP